MSVKIGLLSLILSPVDPCGWTEDVEEEEEEPTTPIKLAGDQYIRWTKRNGKVGN